MAAHLRSPTPCGGCHRTHPGASRLGQTLAAAAVAALMAGQGRWPASSAAAWCWPVWCSAAPGYHVPRARLPAGCTTAAGSGSNNQVQGRQNAKYAITVHKHKCHQSRGVEQPTPTSTHMHTGVHHLQPHLGHQSCYTLLTRLQHFSEVCLLCLHGRHLRCRCPGCLLGCCQCSLQALLCSSPGCLVRLQSCTRPLSSIPARQGTGEEPISQ